VTVDIKITGAENAVTVDLTSLLFTTQNWDLPQRVTVRAVEDDDTDHEEVILEHHVPGIDPVLLPVKVLDTTVDFSTEPSIVPRVFTLWGNDPNPFNSSTHIAFELPEPAMVRVEISDLLGASGTGAPCPAYRGGRTPNNCRGCFGSELRNVPVPPCCCV